MAEWIETFKGVIDAREYDPNAHMNTNAYVTRFDQATWFLLATVGLTPRKVRQQGRRIAVLRQHFQFVKELKGWELIVVESGFIAVGDKHLRFNHRMMDAETGDMVASCLKTAVAVDLAADKTVALDAAVAEAAKARLVTINDADRIDLDSRL